MRDDHGQRIDRCAESSGTVNAVTSNEGDVLGYRCPDCETIVTSEAKAREHCSDGKGWADADFTEPEPEVWPSAWTEHRFWMARKGKMPFAPWGDSDHSDGDPEKDSRWQWSIPDNWADKATVDQWLDKDPTLDGHALILDSQRDPYTDDPDPIALVDGDDVRCPDTGEVHPVFVEFLDRLGLTYADVSQSGSGVHALYEGQLPEDVKRAVFDIDTEPWGANDEVPGIEIYDGKRVCVVTGEHVPGTPEDVRPWDETALGEILDEYVPEADRHTSASHDTDTEDPLDDYEPTVTGANETTDEIRDVYAAIERLRPTDLPLRTSKVGTEGGRDGWEKWDPSTYRTTSGGDSLHRPPDENVFYDQKTGHTFGLLALFAAEQGIVSKPWHDLSGATWFEAVEAARDAGAPIPEYEGSADGPGGYEPVPSIPFGTLCLEPDELRRYARKRVGDWPTTEEVRDRLDETIRDALEAEGYIVIDAPTGAGKTHLVSTTEWANLLEANEDVTGNNPVVILCSTQDARDEAARMAEEASVDTKVLLGYKEACALAAGEHDPENDAGNDPLWIHGEPVSEWIVTRVEERAIAISSVHWWLEHYAGLGYLAHDKQDSINGDGEIGELPCCTQGTRCKTETQWPDNGFTTDDGPRYDAVIATDPFAFVPSLRNQTNIIQDEQPDYKTDLGDNQDHVRRVVTAFLREIDPPREVRTFEDLVSTARTAWGNEQGKPAKQIQAELEDAIANRAPSGEWYVQNENAHTIAAGIVRALWYAAGADPDLNGRRKGTATYHPPRLDDNARKGDGWNRNYVTVVLDDNNEIQTIRETPDFSTARSVVGLDAHPCSHLWERNAHPNVTIEEVLEPTERALWRRLERGLSVVQVGDETRPAGSDGQYFNEEHARSLTEQLRERHGDEFSKAGCASDVEDQMTTLLSEAGVNPDQLDTMYFGEQKSRNDFADELVGLVYGCIDPGDGYVLDLLAEEDLDARPVMIEGEDGKEHREHGRTFEGPDADAAEELLESVRANHVAQMIGRFGRDLDDDEHAVTYVATDAIPDSLIDVQVPGVLWSANPGQKQREVLEYLRENPRVTARETADAVGCSKEHVRQVFAELLKQNKATVRRGEDDYGADVFRWTGRTGPTYADVDLGPDQITNPDVWEAYTWELAIPSRGGPDPGQESTNNEGEWGVLSGQLAGGVDPPPNPGD